MHREAEGVTGYEGKRTRTSGGGGGSEKAKAEGRGVPRLTGGDIVRTKLQQTEGGAYGKGLTKCS